MRRAVPFRLDRDTPNTIVIGAVSAYLAGTDITQHGFTAPPQWFGLIERIDIYGSMLWVVLLAIVLLRTRAADSDVVGEARTRKF